MSSTDLRVVTTTLPDRDRAESVARLLVDAGLAGRMGQRRLPGVGAGTGEIA